VSPSEIPTQWLSFACSPDVRVISLTRSPRTAPNPSSLALDDVPRSSPLTIVLLLALPSSS
jgi:hypothetical protein